MTVEANKVSLLADVAKYQINIPTNHKKNIPVPFQLSVWTSNKSEDDVFIDRENIRIRKQIMVLENSNFL